MSNDIYTTRRKLAVSVAATAVVAMGVLSACGGGGTTKETPTTTTTTTTTTTEPPAPSPSAAPTEKGMTPGGGNKFTPTVKAPGPQTALPGNVITGNR